jgi:hypothetical protein
VFGYSNIGQAVAGYSNSGYGVFGESLSLDGVHGKGTLGVYGEGTSRGVLGHRPDRYGVHGHSYSGTGVVGYSASGYGVYATSAFNLAAFLEGNVRITGFLQKYGGSFKIDRPLDLANKYLSHSFVESPDMKNVYDGVVLLNNKGEAEIELPDWFSALNKDFRYQLTAIGAPGPNLYIAEEISDSVTNYSNTSSGGNNKSRFKMQVVLQV